MRGISSSTSSPLPLLRRWRAWQLQHHQHQHQQPVRPCAAAAHTSSSSSPTETPTPQTQTRLHSDVVSSLARALSRLGIQPGLNSEVCEGLITVDLALQVKGALVAVDVTPRPPDVLGGAAEDGPEPATKGRPRPMQSADTPERAWAMAQARRHVLKAHGWRYVQLPAVEWLGAMGDAEEEEEMLKGRVLAAEGDASHVCGSGCSH